MKLTDLEPQFLKLEGDTYSHVDLAKAEGIMFLCPVCFAKKGSNVGVHSIICWFNGRGVPSDRSPGPGRWNPSGTGFNDLTFVPPGSTSVLLQSSACGAHFFIEGGTIRMC